MMVFGWTWEYVDEYMTLPRLKEVTDYWRDYPPIHEMVAAYFEIGGKGGRKGREKMGIGTTDDLLREFGEMGGTVDTTVWD